MIYFALIPYFVFESLHSMAFVIISESWQDWFIFYCKYIFNEGCKNEGDGQVTQTMLKFLFMVTVQYTSIWLIHTMSQEVYENPHRTRHVLFCSC